MLRSAVRLSAAVGVLMISGAAYASDSPDGATKTDVSTERALQPTFHNTIVSTYPDGRQARLWLDPDGGYRAEGRRGDPSSGHWQIKGEKLCLRQSRPIPVPFTFCTAVTPGAIGSSWTAKAVTGERLRVELVRGRPDSTG